MVWKRITLVLWFLSQTLGFMLPALAVPVTGGAWVANAVVRYIYDGNNVIQERNGNNQPLAAYTWSGNRLLARSDLTTAAPAHAYYHLDGNGNVTALINAQQLIVAKYLYDPFGSTLASSGPLAAANLHRFASKETHPISGLYYYGLRFYDPAVQRWLNRDPIVEGGGINLYGFTGNNPINRFDLHGLKVIGFQVNGNGDYEPMFRYPARSGSRLDWRQGYYSLRDRCHDEFDYRFERIMSEEATALYPYGSLSEWDVFEAIERGYLTEYDLPFGGFSNAWSEHELGYSPTLTVGEAGELAALTLASAIFSGATEIMMAGSLYSVAAEGVAQEQYFISSGVRRSLSSLQNGAGEIPATIVRSGQADVQTTLRLDQLFSPKFEVPADSRLLNIQPPIRVPIEVQPLGIPGQPLSIPLNQVKIVPPGGG